MNTQPLTQRRGDSQRPAEKIFNFSSALIRVLCVSALSLCFSARAQTTPVLFSEQSLTGTVINRTLTLTPDQGQTTPLYNGTNLIPVGAIVLHPTAGVIITNLVSWGYTITMDGWSRSVHILVPVSATLQNAINLINPNPYTGPYIVTGPVTLTSSNSSVTLGQSTNANGINYDLAAAGGGGGGPTNGYTGAQVTNVVANYGSTLYDPIGSASNATNHLGGLAFLSSLTSNLLSGNINIGQIFSGGAIITNRNASAVIISNDLTISGSFYVGNNASIDSLGDFNGSGAISFDGGRVYSDGVGDFNAKTVGSTGFDDDGHGNFDVLANVVAQTNQFTRGTNFVSYGVVSNNLTILSGQFIGSLAGGTNLPATSVTTNGSPGAATGMFLAFNGTSAQWSNAPAGGGNANTNVAQTWPAAQQLTNTGNTVAGNGGPLTNLNAANVSGAFATNVTGNLINTTNANRYGELTPIQFGAAVEPADSSVAFQAWAQAVNAGPKKGWIPAGRWGMTNTLWLTNFNGNTIEGAGITSCYLDMNSGLPLVETWGFLYNHIIGINFNCANGGTNLMILDGGGGFQGVQHNTFVSCMWHGENVCGTGLSIAPYATSGEMGSENSWVNCSFEDFTNMAYYQGNFNSLNNSFYLVGVSGCPNEGLYAGAGIFNIYTGDFSNLAASGIQLGFDIHLASSQQDGSVCCGVRSESLHVISAANRMSIDGFQDQPATSGWQSGHAYSVSNFVTASTDQGILWRCTSGGTSSNTEPVWPFAPFPASPGTITEGTGVSWVQVNDQTVVGARVSLHNANVQYGTAPVGNFDGPNTFSRPDFNALGSGLIYSQFHGQNNVVMTPYSGGTNELYSIQWPANANNDHVAGMWAHNFLTPGDGALLFSYPSQNSLVGIVRANDVGVDPRNDGAYYNDTSTNKITRNVIPFRGSWGVLMNTNAVGTDINIVGGIGTNSLGGGAINFWTQPPGYFTGLEMMSLATNGTLSISNNAVIGGNLTVQGSIVTGAGFTGSGAGLTNVNVNVLNQSVLGAQAANQSNIWFVLNQWTNSANLDFGVSAATNINITGISNTMTGFPFAVTIQQASTVTTNLVTIATNATSQFRLQVFGQFLTMPTNSTASRMTLYFRSTGTNSADLVGQVLFP